jgi:hypothetical protein
VKKIRSDNGSEFKNLQVEEYLEEEGIKHEFSAPYTPQPNGVVERKNRTLIDMARTMLGEFKTPERFWSEAVNTACHAIKRVYLHRLLKKTSYELLTGNKPNVSYFHVFGSKCYILVKKGRSSKFAPKVVEGFLLGYDSNTKAYSVGVLGPTAHPGLPLKVFLGVGRCRDCSKMVRARCTRDSGQCLQVRAA